MTSAFPESPEQVILSILSCGYKMHVRTGTMTLTPTFPREVGTGVDLTEKHYSKNGTVIRNQGGPKNFICQSYIEGPGGGGLTRALTLSPHKGLM